MQAIIPFFNFRGVKDLSRAIRLSEALAGEKFDIVIAIPRSGMVPAIQIALFRNLPVTDLDSYVRGEVFAHGIKRDAPNYRADSHYRRPLIVDDSVDTGDSLALAKNKLKNVSCDPVFLAAYVHDLSVSKVDLHLEIVPMPRVFEWNFWHHKQLLAHSCIDIDGVLCPDPTEAENDDGPNYLRFLSETRSLVQPTHPIGHIVTSRLERYRSETTAWLAQAGISYGQLHMLDLPSASERRERRAHAPFKARVYKETRTSMFVESNTYQAEQIFKLTDRPVLDYTNMLFLDPEAKSISRAVRQSQHLAYRAFRRATHEIDKLVRRG